MSEKNIEEQSILFLVNFHVIMLNENTNHLKAIDASCLIVYFKA